MLALIAQQLAPTAPRHVHYWIDNVAVRPTLAELSIEDALEASSTELSIVGTMASLPVHRPQAMLRVYDHQHDEEVVRGYVVSPRPVQRPGDVDRVEFTAIGLDSLLDDTHIVRERRPAESMKARIGVLWGKYAGMHLSPSLALVQDIGGELAETVVEHATLRQAIEEAVIEADPEADYRVDQLGRLVVFLVQANPAPFVVSDVPVLAPLLDGGERATIVDDGAYNAFPGLAPTGDGRHLAVWRAAASHTSGDGEVWGAISADLGLTWGTPFLIRADAGWDLRDPNVVLTSAGTLVLNFIRVAGDDKTVWALRSTDQAATWSAPVSVPTALAYTAASAAARELASGDLLISVFGPAVLGDDPFWRVMTVRSSDDGASWGAAVLVADGKALHRTFNESSLVESGGELWILLRETATGGTGDGFWRAASVDDGATWSAPALVTTGRGRPSMLLLADGRILLVTRSAGATLRDRSVWRTSGDDGLTWTDEELLDPEDGGDKFEYAWMVQDGATVLVVYCLERSSGNSDGYARQLSVPPAPARINPFVSIDFDAVPYANRVFIEGAMPRATRYFQDDAAIRRAHGLVRTRVVKAPGARNAVQAERYARRFFRALARSRVRGSFTTTSPNDGWQAGQVLRVVKASMAVDSVEPIESVVRRLITGTPGGPIWRWVIRFGGKRAGDGS